ncbi:MAG: gamma-glutamyl-gamma-aminobutyrate hydrolase family protein, partial [Armatimonadota bacterium]
AYLDCLERAGATPLMIPDLADDRLLSLLELAQGLLVTGGGDFDPRTYGRQPHAKLGSINPRRDHLDRIAIEFALGRPEIPLLGICRGIQSLNVVAGGTLLQDVGSEVEGALKHGQSAPGWYATHDISLAEGSRLREILGCERVAVNSFHHQAVDQVAEGFRAVAHTDDGVIEAIERGDGAFCIGLQCHPELMAPRDERMAGIFEAFVAACR